ncbi:hypothetical protein A0H81_09685 [Grifola frondosa]|uniref:Uncharacterized protein n=1 Tax=Grifola frondosa TaxID=5627 RepID=A0A1C7M615_GRIFR|nr:hypothetical protein A0H81_09685 [Grifola frondosa]
MEVETTRAVPLVETPPHDFTLAFILTVNSRETHSPVHSNMLGALVNRPNHVVEKQKLVQASTAPIYYRLPHSRLYVNTYFSLFALGALGSLYGAFSLIRGKPKTE